MLCARGLVIAVVGLALVPCQADPPPVNHPPAAVFGEIPNVANPQLAPDGKHYVTIENNNGRPAAVIRSVDPGGNPPAEITSDKDILVYARWAKDDRMVMWLSATVDTGRWFTSHIEQHGSILSSDVRGTAPYLRLGCGSLRDLGAQIAPTIVDYVPDSREVLIPGLMPGLILEKKLGTLDKRGMQVLCRTNVYTNSGGIAALGSSDTIKWLTDGQGRVIGRVDQTEKPLVDHLILRSGPKSWAEVAAIDASGGHGLDIEGLDADGKSLVMGAVSPTSGTSGLQAITFAEGKTSDIFFDPHYDVDETLIDPWTQRVVGVTVIEDRATDRYFSAQHTALQNGLEHAFPGKTVHTLSWDRAHNRLTIRVSGPRNPPAYYLLDRTTHAASLLLQTYQGLSENDLGEMKPYPYKARDGLDIPAYLTLPPGKEAKNLPVVIMPHGGPMARDQIDFDWEAQFLANRGYAVLQPNFRGSSGYGNKFLEAGFGEWGLKMQDDVTDGVKKLIADGIADPKRICIVGGSYGGYAALAGAAFTPDLYACAASWGGVFDLQEFLSDRANDYGEDSAMISSWSHFIGDRSKDADKLDAASPAKHARQIVNPVLLLHGADDTTVRIEQSEAMERALRRAGKKVTFISVPGEIHYMVTSASRVRWLTELEKFLKENIGN